MRSTNTELFLSFLKIGAFTVGGGMAMVPLMENEIVTRHGWLTKEEFLDIFAVAQASPGVMAVNMASHIGHKISGMRGALLASVANILPSLVCILAIAFFFRAFQENHWVEAAFKGIRPAVVALIALPVFTIMRSARITWRNCWIPILSTLLIWAWGVSPVWIVIAAGLGGYVYGRLRRKGE